MSKPLYKSTTIQAALSGFAVLLINTGYSMWDPETGTFRAPTQVEVATVLGGGLALKETIAGRIKATEDIGDPKKEKARPKQEQELISTNSTDVDSVDYEESGELQVDFNTSGTYKVIALRDTVIKTSFQDSNTLGPTEQTEVIEGQEINIDAYKFIGKNNHIEISISGSTYFLFVPHIKLLNDSGKEVNLVDNSSPTPVVNPKKTPIKLPGYQSTFYLEDSVIPGGNFTWNEVTHGGTRIPQQKSHVDNAIALCKHLQGLREHLGNIPMRVTSFYRPEPINSRVGGARNSFHLTGAACDFYVPGANMRTIEEKTRVYWLNNRIGGVGLAASSNRNFVHVDLGPIRSFPY